MSHTASHLPPRIGLLNVPKPPVIPTYKRSYFLFDYPQLIRISLSCYTSHKIITYLATNFNLIRLTNKQILRSLETGMSDL